MLDIKYIEAVKSKLYNKAPVTTKIASESADKTGKSDCLAQHNGLTLFLIFLIVAIIFKKKLTHETMSWVRIR